MPNKGFLQDISESLKYFKDIGIPIDEVISEIAESAKNLEGLASMTFNDMRVNPELGTKIGAELGSRFVKTILRHLNEREISLEEANRHTIKIGALLTYFAIGKYGPFGKNKEFRNVYDFLAEMQK